MDWNAPTERSVLLKDWGMHHLHPADQVEADGYVKRGDNVLVASSVMMRLTCWTRMTSRSCRLCRPRRKFPMEPCSGCRRVRTCRIRLRNGPQPKRLQCVRKVAQARVSRYRARHSDNKHLCQHSEGVDSLWDSRIGSDLIKVVNVGALTMPISLQADYDADGLQMLACRTEDGPQTRRLLALAAISGSVQPDTGIG